MTDSDLAALATMLGVPLWPGNRQHLESILAERERRGITEVRSLGAVQSASARECTEVEAGEDEGVRCGRYLVEDAGPVSEGSLRAHDPDLGREVTLRLASVKDAAELSEQSRLHARLEHPSIQPLHDVGLAVLDEIDTDVAYSVERQRDRTGRGLDELMEERPGRELLGYLRDVALALDHAHRRNVARGGIKASDVTVGSFGEVVVWDWTGARDLADADGTEAQARDMRDLVSLLLTLACVADEVPEDLASVVEKGSRGQGTARAVVVALGAHLERAAEAARNRRAAQAIVHEAQTRLEEWRGVQTASAELEQRAQAQMRTIILTNWDEPGRREYWRLRGERRDARRKSVELLATVRRHLRAALRQDPETPEAREALAELHWDAMVEAERWGRREEARREKRGVVRHDRGNRVELLDEPGLLRVESDPPGAQVTLLHHVPRHGGRILVEEEVGTLGSLPPTRPGWPRDPIS